MRYLAQAMMWLCLPGSLYAQALNTPSDFQSLISVSEINYQSTAELWQDTPAQPLPINTGVFVVKYKEDKQLVKYTSVESNFVKKRKVKAARYIVEKDYEKAKQALQQALKKMPQHADLMKAMAEIHKKGGSSADALTWYKKAVKTNPIDYQAYLKTAQMLRENGDYELAFKAVLHAKVLNRYCTDVQSEVERIALLNGLNYRDWSFIPKFTLVKKGNDVQIAYTGEPWRAYATSEAFWEHEPGYSDTKSVTEEYDWDMIRYKESLLNGVVAYKILKYSNKKEEYPEIDAFSTAVSEGFIDEYIQYEIIALKRPHFIHTLEKPDIQRIVQYMLVTHFEKIPEKYVMK